MGVKYIGLNNAVFWDVFMVVTMANIFWEITLFGSSKSQRFGEHIASIFSVIGLLSIPSSQRGYSPQCMGRRVSCYGTSTVASIRYRGIVDGPLLCLLFLD
jgi:hypothetical protein